MRRVGRETIRLRLLIALKVRKPYEKRALGILSTDTLEAVVDEVVSKVVGAPASEAVILLPSMTGPSHSPRPGKWDIDEPDPFPDLPISDH